MTATQKGLDGVPVVASTSVIGGFFPAMVAKQGEEPIKTPEEGSEK